MMQTEMFRGFKMPPPFDASTASDEEYEANAAWWDTPEGRSLHEYMMANTEFLQRVLTTRSVFIKTRGRPTHLRISEELWERLKSESRVWGLDEEMGEKLEAAGLFCGVPVRVGGEGHEFLLDFTG